MSLSVKIVLKGVHFLCLGVHFGGANQEKKIPVNRGISTEKMPLKRKNSSFRTLYVQVFLISNKYKWLIISVLFVILM